METISPVTASRPPLQLLELPTDVLRIIFSFITLTYAHLPTRFACRRFLELLPPPSRGQVRYYSRGAAAAGSLKMLKWARVNGWPWDAWVCAYAAEYGHLEILQWLHANGCPWSEDTSTWATRSGHFEILKWAHANGCWLGDRACDHAAERGHLDILKWLRANG